MNAYPWLEALAAGVRERLAQGRLPHALLVTGPAGWGEAALANWIALHLLGVAGDRDAAALAHPDLRWVQPEGAVIKVDQVRELVAFAQGTPQAGPRKVAVLAQAHCLNQSAANALLKTLEEPPLGTHLVLFSAHPGRLLATIRSRCQQLVIRPDPAAAERWLAANAATDDLAERLFEHGGAPVAVVDGLERGERPLAELLERALVRGAEAEVVQALLETDLADTLGRWYRYVLALAADGWRPRGLPAPAPRQVAAFADELVWARRLLVTSNSANERLVVERLVARWRDLRSAAA